jgi:hypothetical protein
MLRRGKKRAKVFSPWLTAANLCYLVFTAACVAYSYREDTVVANAEQCGGEPVPADVQLHHETLQAGVHLPH